MMKPNGLHNHYLRWLSVALSAIHHVKQLKHRYCCCRPPIVTFIYYEFSALSCATKLEKVPHFCTKYSRERLKKFTPADIWALISWHLSFWGCKHQEHKDPQMTYKLGRTKECTPKAQPYKSQIEEFKIYDDLTGLCSTLLTHVNQRTSNGKHMHFTNFHYYYY